MESDPALGYLRIQVIKTMTYLHKKKKKKSAMWLYVSCRNEQKILNREVSACHIPENFLASDKNARSQSI